MTDLNALINTLAENVANFALSEGYAADAFEGEWGPYELLPGDLEYIRGEQVDSPEGLPLPNPGDQGRLEIVVQGRVRAILDKATAEYAMSIACESKNHTLVEKATRCVGDKGDWRDLKALERLALERVTPVLLKALRGLEPGQCLTDGDRKWAVREEDGELMIRSYGAEPNQSYSDAESAADQLASNLLDLDMSGIGREDAIAYWLTGRTPLDYLEVQDVEVQGVEAA